VSGRPESGSPCLDAPVTSTRRRQLEQSTAWAAAVLNNFPCFLKALCVVDALHGWEMAANDALHCLHHALEGLAISSRAAAKPDSNAAREDACNGAPVKVSNTFCRHARRFCAVLTACLDQELEAGDFLHFSSVDVSWSMTPPITSCPWSSP